MTVLSETSSPRPAIVVLGKSGVEIAQKIADSLQGAEIHGSRRRIGEAEVLFEDTATHLRALFTAGRPLIGICAAGILIRALAGTVSDKQGEPPVVAVAEDGSVAIPLLGGHHGANDLVRQIADATGAVPALTTAGDVRFGVALDCPPRGWTLANPENARVFMATLLDGAAVHYTDDHIPAFLEQAPIPRNGKGLLRITATTRTEVGSDRHLVYHPSCVAVGVGCERGVAPGELAGLVAGTLQESGLAPGAVAGVFSIDLKENEPAIHAVAAKLGVPARFFDPATLEACTPRLHTPSEVVFRAVGCHGVAEAAALVAAGVDSSLAVPKRKSARATCAVAVAKQVIDPVRTGKAQGRLLVVGTGPGGEGWMTAECTRAVEMASDLVGYKRYLDLPEVHAQGKRLHGFALGKEVQRVNVALDLAASGRTVALVSSGDPGIYAMASLVFEQLERVQREDWRRVAIEVCPGVSALQAAAARAGAPLGHDFCTISLSDLLTPWEVIERRIEAAAQGDFVIVFYNPASSRRNWQLEAAGRILLLTRPPATPVVIARNVGRAGESLTTTTLADLRNENVDMFSIVIVGSTATRSLDRGAGRMWIYTPRGYGRSRIDGAGAE